MMGQNTIFGIETTMSQLQVFAISVCLCLILLSIDYELNVKDSTNTQSTATHRLTTRLEQARGVIGRYPDPDETYVFEFDGVGKRWIHMFGVHRPLEVEWYADGDLVKKEVLSPWVGLGRARADRVIERRPTE